MSSNASLYAGGKQVQEVEALRVLKMKTKFTPASRVAWLEEVVKIGQQLLVRIQYKDPDTDQIMTRVIAASSLLKYEVVPERHQDQHETLYDGAMKQKVVKREIIDIVDRIVDGCTAAEAAAADPPIKREADGTRSDEQVAYTFNPKTCLLDTPDDPAQ